MKTYNEARDFANMITKICEGILLRAGPYQKESLYQSMLMHELNLLSIPTSREQVFPMQFRDSKGNKFSIGDNQYFRSDIECPVQLALLELKSQECATTTKNIWQLRQYLCQRDDMKWGIVINFISNFSKNHCPKVQCDIIWPFTISTLNKEVEYGLDPEIAAHARMAILKPDIERVGQDHTKEKFTIPQFITETIYSKQYHSKKDIIFTYKCLS